VDDAAFRLADLFRRVGMRGEFAARLSKLGMRAIAATASPSQIDSVVELPLAQRISA
jgi:hypothetical protein